MPNFPEQCYQFTRAQDLASQHLAVVWRKVNTSYIIGATLLGGSVVYTVPADRALQLQSIVVRLVPAGAEIQSVWDWAIYAGKSGLPFMHQLGGEIADNQAFPGQPYSVTFRFDTLIPPSYSITPVVTPVGAMFGFGWLETSVTGMLIPRGNVTEA